MKLKWTRKDAAQARAFGWELRPWRYEETDGCWTIRRTEPTPFLSDDHAIAFVIRQGFFRDGCETKEEWLLCQKAALLSAGAENRK